MPTISEQLTQLISDRDDLVDNLTTKGITGLTGDETFTELVSEVLNIPSGGTPVIAPMKDVNFYDYDGTRLYSYTLSEIQELTELPALPSHTGLICQGWNWTLADIKAENKGIDVGAIYITDDGKTRLYIRISSKGRMTVPICFQQSIANGVEVNWGDGSAVETFNDSGTTNILPTHTYSSIGNYVITLNPLSNCNLTLGGTSTCIMGNNNNNNIVYKNMLHKVEIGRNASISSYGFINCYSLSNITIPNSITSIESSAFSGCNSLASIEIPEGVTSIGDSAFKECSSLTSIEIPEGVTSIGNSAFRVCNSLTSIEIPNSVTRIGSSAFNGCKSLTSINIPDGVTSIGSSAFYGCNSLASIEIPNKINNVVGNVFLNCYGIKYYDFSSYTAMPTLDNINAFSDIASDCKIIVPDSLYEDWIVATNWSTYASYIIKKTDWEAL